MAHHGTGTLEPQFTSNSRGSVLTRCCARSSQVQRGVNVHLKSGAAQAHQ
jgi:hypothetical protein